MALKLRDIKPYLKILEELDPQYGAVKKLIESRGFNNASLLSILNALISYQLCIPGEEYWEEFSDYFSNKNIEINSLSFRNFLLSIKCLRNIDQKIRRVEKVLASPISIELLRQGDAYCKKINTLIKDLARVLGVENNSKTLVFTAKIYGYLCRAIGSEPVYNDIAIPVDYRNSLLAITSCIVQLPPSLDLKEYALELTKLPYAEKIRALYRELCELSSIPCIDLDTFTWLFTGIALESGLNPAKTINLFKYKYGIEISLETAKTLLECAIRNV